MRKYFQLLNLTECNDALMGYNLLFNQACIETDYWSDGTVYVYICTHTNTYTHSEGLNYSSSPQCHQCQNGIVFFFVNYHKIPLMRHV